MDGKNIHQAWHQSIMRVFSDEARAIVLRNAGGGETDSGGLGDGKSVAVWIILARTRRAGRRFTD